MADKPQEPAQPSSLYSLVVVGASAGGIEALSTVLAKLPADFPLPIVVAQHLDPRQPSHLTEILARRSALPVRTVIDREGMIPGTVYVVPADRHVEISDAHLRLLADTLPRPKPSINLLLSSAARAYGERLIAVILTWTGTDGAAGAREVKAAGGTVVIENPETAAYPGMPASLAPTTVDLVADLPQIGSLLLGLVRGTVGAAMSGVDEVEAGEAGEAQDQSLQRLLAQVRERIGIDFSSYKRPTILRRLQRRLIATSSGDLPEYAAYLTTHPEEYQRLSASFLIKVTEFFRDDDLFGVLREKVVPELLAQARTRGNVLRLWSAGCATGEEAYSLAILVAEALGDELERFQVQLFATDLDEGAIAFARHGIYPPGALSGLPEVLVARYFTRLDGNYEVTKRLRGLLIFGQHDLGQRPPFPHIDLVLCRNVLIYFTPDLQARALQLFAFALRDGGYLALGKAETVRPLEAYFAPAHSALKLYRRQGERVLGPIALITDLEAITKRLPQPSGRSREHRLLHSPKAPRRGILPKSVPLRRLARGETEAGERPRTTGEWLGTLLLGLPVGVVVVDRHYDIQAINNAALRLLGIYTVALGEDLIHLTRTIPTAALRSAIDAAFAGLGRPRVPGGLANPAYPDPGGGRPGDAEAAETIVTIETVLGERRHLHITCYPYLTTTNVVGPTDRPSALVPAPKVDVAAVLLFIEDITDPIREQEQVTAAAEHQRAEQATQVAHAAGDRERAFQHIEAENARLKAEMDEVGGVNRTLLKANQDLSAMVLDLRQTSEELLVSHEEAQASAEEVKTLNEELQASNEELVTVNEELEATVEELHASNDDLQARGHELRESSETLAAQRADSETKRAQLEAILLSLADAVLVVDPEGTIVLTNAAYADLFGGASSPFTAEDGDGHPLPPETTPPRRVARGETFTMEFTCSAPDGTRRWFEASGQPIRGESDLGGVLAIRDVTERSLHRLEDEFMALANHELRTPLTSLCLRLDQLSKWFAAQPADSQASRGRLYTAQAQQQEQRLERLVQDLLDVRRLQRGGFRVEMERLALDQIVAQTVEIAQAMTTDHTLHLEVSDAPIVIDGDATRLEQVLFNLLTNAITYTPHATRIEVRLRRVGAEAELVVRDDGPGMAAAELPHLFLRFYQVGRAATESPTRGGLGLGLYIVHELVAAHGGQVEVDSVAAPANGHGTRFTIHLPLASAQRKPPDE